MRNLEEDINDLKDRISFKEKHISAAEAVRDYKRCDEITEELSQLTRRAGRRAEGIENQRMTI